MIEEEIRETLRERIGRSTAEAWCRREGVARSHVSGFMNGTESPQAALLTALGLGWETVDRRTGAIVGEDGLRARLRPLVARSSVAAWSRDAGVPRSAARDLLAFTRRPTRTLAHALGAEWRIVRLSPAQQEIARRTGGQRRPRG